MKKTDEMLRMERDMNENPGLMEKLETEFMRIVDAKEAESDGEALLKAAAALGYTITLDEQDRAAAELEAVDDEELEKVAGGIEEYDKTQEWCVYDYKCVAAWNSSHQDEKGHDNWCVTGWHCYVATLHSEAESEEVSCLKDYRCELVFKDIKHFSDYD